MHQVIHFNILQDLHLVLNSAEMCKNSCQTNHDKPAHMHLHIIYINECISDVNGTLAINLHGSLCTPSSQCDNIYMNVSRMKMKTNSIKH